MYTVSMPSRHVSKQQLPESYYHVYARGADKQKIFLEQADYRYFIRLFERYLSHGQALSKTGEPYPNYRGKVDLLAYCLMTNHFHLLLYQHDVPGLEKFMRSLMTSYSRYFNLKYKRTGPLFGSRYKAVRIDSDSYLQHISRYIHLNPRRWEQYRFSSFRTYVDGGEPEWLMTGKILAGFSSRSDYAVFVSDYEYQQDILQEIKLQLADN